MNSERGRHMKRMVWAGRAAKVLLAGSFVVAIAMAAVVTRTSAQQQPELIIRNGLIVSDQGRMQADVRVRGEKIVEIGARLAATPGAREIEASGMFLLPGIIDTHTHLPVDVSIAPP